MIASDAAATLIHFYAFTGLDKGECTDIERVKSMVPKTFQKYVEREYWLLFTRYYSDNGITCIYPFWFTTGYGKGEEEILIDDEWENSYSEILETSIEPAIKMEPYESVKVEPYEEDMYDDDDYSETSNID